MDDGEAQFKSNVDRPQRRRDRVSGWRQSLGAHKNSYYVFLMLDTSMDTK